MEAIDNDGDGCVQFLILGSMCSIGLLIGPALVYYIYRVEKALDAQAQRRQSMEALNRPASAPTQPAVPVYCKPLYYVTAASGLLFITMFVAQMVAWGLYTSLVPRMGPMPVYYVVWQVCTFVLTWVFANLFLAAAVTANGMRLDAWWIQCLSVFVICCVAVSLTSCVIFGTEATAIGIA